MKVCRELELHDESFLDLTVPQSALGLYVYWLVQKLAGTRMS